MPPPHLFLERPSHALGVELPALFPDRDLEREMQQEIAQLVAQGGGLTLGQGPVELEGFFHEIRPERGARLGAIPGTAGAQVAHQREGAGEGGVPRRG